MFLHLKNYKVITAITYDIIMSIFSFYFAVCLRFETLYPFSGQVTKLPLFMSSIVISQIIYFKFMGLYRGIWRYSSVTDLSRIIKASVYGTLTPVVILFLWNRLEGFPRSIVIIDMLILIITLGGGRFIYRVWKDSRQQKKINLQFKDQNISNVIIIGAGSAGNQLLKEIINNNQLGLRVVGFVDDEVSKYGRTIQNVKVLGSSYELVNLVPKYNIKKIFIATPSATGDDLKRIINCCKETKVDFKTLPKINEILSGKVELSLLRNVKIEDLLGRDPISLDFENLGEMITNKVIMVTGAGGSIGSELCNQISQLNPRRIVLFEICELFLYELEMNLSLKYPDIEFIPCIGDIRFYDRVESVVKKHRPQLILHAAAYKHVPLMEQNPLEAIYTNILGTQIISELACKYNCDKFVMISTDKAVNPTNIMGCSKRIAEMICTNTNKTSEHTKFITVRFGNVLGSSGSVIPLFKKQIERGGPVTVTHKDITRYFMSIPEACQLVLQSATMGNGGEIFVLDMGTPVKISELAKDLIILAGLQPEKDVMIKYTGLRPGEKLYEELFTEDESLLSTSHKKVHKAQAREIQKNFQQLIHNILCLKNSSDRSEIYQEIKNLVNEFDSKELLSN